MTEPLLIGYRRLLRPALFRLGRGDPESAHERALGLLARVSAIPAVRAGLSALHAPGEPIEVAGIAFGNRVGLAAGLDKQGAAVRAWGPLGFGHVELGTVTPRPQPGNPRPRIHRFPRSGAIVNAMGFPSEGATALAARLARLGIRRGDGAAGARIGISIGKNKDTPLADAPGDYLAAFAALHAHADYIAVNVSSPNTPGLRTLQDAGTLGELLRALTAAARSADPARPVPIMVKVAPDLGPDALDELLSVCVGAGVAGLIAGNTTLDRTGLAPADRRPATDLAGGLSGRPLTRRALGVVRHLAGRGPLPVIGAGGIMTPDDARAMFDAGARLVQLYTGWIYSGPALVNAINRLPYPCRPEE